jgi:uncharacterized protein (DUF1778 family)
MTLRIPDEMDSELRAAADAEDLSINGFVLAAIQGRLEARRHGLVMAAAREVIAADEGILRRLADA